MCRENWNKRIGYLTGGWSWLLTAGGTNTPTSAPEPGGFRGKRLVVPSSLAFSAIEATNFYVFQVLSRMSYFPFVSTWAQYLYSFQNLWKVVIFLKLGLSYNIKGKSMKFKSIRAQRKKRIVTGLNLFTVFGSISSSTCTLIHQLNFLLTIKTTHFFKHMKPFIILMSLKHTFITKMLVWIWYWGNLLF